MKLPISITYLRDLVFFVRTDSQSDNTIAFHPILIYIYIYIYIYTYHMWTTVNI